MGSKTTPSLLPTIDLPKNYSDTLLCGTEERKLLCRSVREALEDYGFLVVKYDEISEDEKEEMFECTRRLMDLPMETKLRHASMSPYYPYVPPNEVVPYYEAFGVMNTWLPEKALEFTQLMWPDGNDKFCQTMSTLSNKTLDLVRTLLDVICDGYGVERPQSFHVDSTDTTLRLAKYRAPTRDEPPALGLLPHIDGSYLTLLCNNGVEGLTVKSKDGSWIEVNPGKDSFVLFVGQALKAWSNGRLYAPLHKVTVSREDRFMCGLFFLPKADQIIQPHQGFVDEEHPTVFKPFDYGEFLHYAVKTQSVEGTLESFTSI